MGMMDFELQRVDEVVELLENFVIEMLKTKKVNATVLRCYIDLIKLKHDGKDDNTTNSIVKTQEIIKKMLSEN
jgi:hypothetical protein